MRPLRPEEVSDLRAFLREWREPREVHAALCRVSDTAGLFTVGQGGLRTWREAFVAMSCLQLSHARRLRLGLDPPDFELEYQDHVQAFELVDILPAGRKLGEDYRRYAHDLNACGSTMLQRIGGEKEHMALPADFERQLKAKMAKGYSPPPILVADVHHELVPGSDFTMEQHLAEIAEIGLKSFREIWIRKSASIIRVTPHGATRMCVIGPLPD